MADNTASKATKVFGFGYSEVAAQLMSSLDQPLMNSDAKIHAYKEMMDDETIGTGMEFLTYAVVSKIGAYSHEDERIKEFVNHCRESLLGTMEESRRALLENGLAYGFGVSEFSIMAEDSQWLLTSLQAYDPGTLSFRFERDNTNALVIKEVIQKVAGKDLKIPADKVMVFRHGRSSSPYGRSRLRRCWRWYSFKKVIPKFWAVALERFGMPALVGKSDDIEQMSKILQGAYSKSFFSIGEEDSIEALTGSSSNSTTGECYEKAISFCNKMLYRAMFLPSLLEGGEGGGSYSLGQIHWRMFNDACLWIARELAEVEIEQLWKTLIDWNFGSQENYGSIDVSDSGTPEEREIVSKIFLNAVNGGWLYPDEGDAEWMRERLGMPAEAEGGDPVSWRSNLSKAKSKAEDGAGVPE